MSKAADTSESVECPECGFSSDTVAGVKNHYRQTHELPYPEDLRLGTVELECEQCGGKYERRPYAAESSRFCCNECQMKARHGAECPECGEYFTVVGMRRHFGQAHPDTPKPWIDENNSRSAVCEKRKKVDNTTCQRCGCDVGGKNDDAKTGHAHHIIPVRAGGSNNINNLVTLCKDCHTEAHRDLSILHETHPDLLDELRAVVCDEEGTET
jgi:5-methylcytosine-specific restriction endonuclease McrA